MDHQLHHPGNVLSIVSVVFAFILAHIGLNGIASMVAILSGCASLFINWPKIKQRVKDFIKSKR